MIDMNCKLGALTSRGLLKPVSGMTDKYWERIKNLEVSWEDVPNMAQWGYIGISEEFKKVIETFEKEKGFIPAGFRTRFIYGDDCVQVDLVRDISYACNNKKRPTGVLYSADSANPYDVVHLKDFIANLTCNPAIIYDSFINNPLANIGGKFKDRYEVMEELCKILGSGVDISIEVDDPFASESAVIEEIERFKEILTPYRLVVKIPHMGPLNKDNKQDLLVGKFEKGFEEGNLADNVAGHKLAFMLSERAYRINFTLMFEPHQIQLALLTKPYFINAFIKQRYNSSLKIAGLVEQYQNGNREALDKLALFMHSVDMISGKEAAGNKELIFNKAMDVLTYRNFFNKEGSDGLDCARHALRVLRSSNLESTRLIICSMSDEQTYMSIDKMLMEAEFADMTDRVVITAPPEYLSRYASASGVLSYQRVFLNAVK